MKICKLESYSTKVTIVYITQLSAILFSLHTKLVPIKPHTVTASRNGLPESTPARFCVFLSDPDPHPESKICEKPDSEPESLFHFGSSTSLCGHFLGKNMCKLRLDRWL